MAITVFAVNYLQLCALLFALDHFPANNPRRWEAIASYIEMLTQKDEDVTGLELFDMYLTQTTATKRSKRVFTGSPQECRDLTNIIHTSYPHIISTVKQLYQPLLSNPDRKSPLTLWLPRYVNIILVCELTSSNLNYYCLLLGPTALQNALREIP